MKIKRIILRIEAEKVGGSSKIFVGGTQLSQEEIEKSEILFDIFEDETFSEIGVAPFEKCYVKSIGNETNKYVVYGNLKEKDECNRYMAYSACVEAQELDGKFLADIVAKEFSQIGYTILSEQSESPIPAKRKKKGCRAKFMILFLIIITLLTIFALC